MSMGLGVLVGVVHSSSRYRLAVSALVALWNVGKLSWWDHYCLKRELNLDGIGKLFSNWRGTFIDLPVEGVL